MNRQSFINIAPRIFTSALRQEYTIEKYTIEEGKKLCLNWKKWKMKHDSLKQYARRSRYGHIQQGIYDIRIKQIVVCASPYRRQGNT